MGRGRGTGTRDWDSGTGDVGRGTRDSGLGDVGRGTWDVEREINIRTVIVATFPGIK